MKNNLYYNYMKIILIIIIIIILYLLLNPIKKKPINKIIKIIIIGGGWAGISTAYVLSHHKQFDITLIEKENQLGGEAVSVLKNECNVEYNGQIYFDLFYCVKKILKDSGLLNQLCPINQTIITDSKKSLTLDNLFDQYNSYELLKYYGVDDFTCLKLFYLLALPQAILEKFYSQTPFVEYLNNYDIFKLICGPIMGLEPAKVCVTTVISILGNKLSSYRKNKVTCGPSNITIFNYLKDFLKSRGVNVLLNTECVELINQNNKIIQIKTNSNTYLNCDEIILSCSLTSLINLFSKFNTKLNKQLNQLTSCLQNYCVMNLYLSEPLGLDRNYIILEQPWQPSIETKRSKHWQSYIQKNCNVKDIWSAGVIDYYKGYNGKILVHYKKLLMKLLNR